MAQLNEQTVRAIRLAVAAGEVQRRVAARFGINYKRVSSIVRRHSWAHVLP
jgi:hypothetical protein